MKKLLTILVSSCAFGLFVLASDVPTTQGPGDGGGSCSCPGSGGTVHYKRETKTCPNNGMRTEVTCEVGGNELCIPQNCP
jgi:hypothetical protein